VEFLNSVVLIGRLTADPELKHTQNGNAVTGFSIAVDRPYQKAGEERQADFIDIVAWRGTAEFICKYFKKGRKIAVQGAIQNRSYTDKDGNKRKAFEVLAEKVEFADSKQEKKGSADVQYTPESGGFEESMDDGLAF
jgi:single-strand DNA-binding protein